MIDIYDSGLPVASARVDLTAKEIACYRRQQATVTNVQCELLRQLERWQVQRHDPLMWNAILGEEAGEVAKAALEATVQDYHRNPQLLTALYTELVQCAAVAIAAAESIRTRLMVGDVA